MACSIKDMEQALVKMQKYDGFVTEQSSNITLQMVCEANTKINHSNAVFLLNNTVCNMKVASEMEAGVFEYTLIYIKSNNLTHTLIAPVYEHKITELIKNINLNPNLYTDIKNGHIKPRMMAFMTPQQLCPEKWNDLLTKKRLKEEKENNVPTIDTYTCYKCGQKKCSIRFLQTRSIDEPMTGFVTCQNCYNTFTV